MRLAGVGEAGGELHGVLDDAFSVLGTHEASAVQVHVSVEGSSLFRTVSLFLLPLFLLFLLFFLFLFLFLLFLLFTFPALFMFFGICWRR